MTPRKRLGDLVQRLVPGDALEAARALGADAAAAGSSSRSGDWVLQKGCGSWDRLAA